MFCECGCGQKTRIAQYSDARWGRIKNQPIRFIHGHANRVDPKIRFLQKFFQTDTDECWPWLAMTRGGYGMLSVGGKMIGAHRFSYEYFVGLIPEGLDCLHRCDNPTCVNPGHLFVGTHKENMDDCHQKGRRRALKGEEHHNARLSEKDVKKIRELYPRVLSFVVLSSRFKVTPEQISNVVHRRAWQHI